MKETKRASRSIHAYGIQNYVSYTEFAGHEASKWNRIQWILHRTLFFFFLLVPLRFQQFAQTHTFAQSHSCSLDCFRVVEICIAGHTNLICFSIHTYILIFVYWLSIVVSLFHNGIIFALVVSFVCISNNQTDVFNSIASAQFSFESAQFAVCWHLCKRIRSVGTVRQKIIFLGSDLEKRGDSNQRYWERERGKKKQNET